MSYLNKFVDSIRFLEEFDMEHKRANLNYEEVASVIKRRLLDKDLNDFLEQNLGDTAQRFIENSPQSLENLCHSVSQQFYENWMSQPIGDVVPVAITVGNVKFRNREIYKVSKSSIKKTIARGFCPDESLELHVWLTFSNMTVLDLTIVPTLIYKGLASLDDFDGCQYVIWKEGEGEEFDYIPLLQHNNFMYEIDRYV
ncbi:hypothetical protein [Aeromonas caviae]|uniref:hypothetical protein n=1 Tax=Aeromonas caviae TaxID=648 RepID=UPI00301443C8